MENSQVCGDYTTKQPMIKEEIKREIRKHLETSEYGNTTYQIVCVLCAQSCPTLRSQQALQSHQAPLSLEFSRQEYWSGLLFPSPTKMYGVQQEQS